jgi:outer membrane immunogenic protein
MSVKTMMLAGAVLAALSNPAWGQEIGSAPDASAFTGAYAGPELGAHEHHVFIETTALPRGATTARYYRAWGVGGGAFAGYDVAIAPRIRLGLEAGISLGGQNPTANFADGTFYTQRPRYGFRGTARAGYILGDRLLAYGTFGYGGHRYRLGGNANISDAHEWGSSFTIGAGFEYRASRRVGVRLDFRHLDNQMSHLLVGVPIRF